MADSLMQKSAIMLTKIHYSSSMYFEFYVLLMNLRESWHAAWDNSIHMC